jgi:hypothetical protein
MASRITELEAVNGILRMLGRRPVNSLAADDLTPDASFILQELRQVSRQVQLVGWHWNSERSVKMVLDGDDRVPLTDDIARVDNAKRVGPHTRGVDITMRAIDGIMYLWDKAAQARDDDPFDFSEVGDVRIDLVRLLDFEETPDAFRHYVSIRAGRNAQARIISDPSLYRFSQDDEARALQVLQKEELDTSDANALSQTWIGRRQSPINRLETL